MDDEQLVVVVLLKEKLMKQTWGHMVQDAASCQGIAKASSRHLTEMSRAGSASPSTVSDTLGY